MDYSQAWQRLEHTNTYTQGIPGFQGWFCPISSGFSGYQRLYSFWLESGQKVVNYEVYAKDLGFGSSRIYLYTWNLFLSFVLGVEPPKKQVLFGFQVHTLYIISFVIVNTCNWGIYAVRSNRYINQFVLQVYTTCLHNLFAWFHPLNSCRRWPCLSGPPCLEFQWWRSIPERRSCVSLRKWRDTVPPPRNIMGNLLE